MALIGREIFYDPLLSGSGRLSCASCHDPHHHYGPSNNQSVFVGGKDLKSPGRRAIPSLAYLEHVPNFSIGPDNPESETAPVLPSAGATASHVAKSAVASSTTAIVPQGGLFWDGRADTLQQQASGPLFDPAEMASTPSIARTRIENAPYTKRLKALAGPAAEASPDLLLSEAMFALARYQIEEPSFHRYNSKFDAWLEGKTRFTPQESAGYRLFNDPMKGNCAACHLDRPLPGNLPPLLTDRQYEALGAPRNTAVTGPYENGHFDLGLCEAMPGGAEQSGAYCGMFATPTLRNVADRKVFFHNGVFHDLKQVLDFYVLRDIQPELFYSPDAQRRVRKADDLPAQYQPNLDRTDAPMDRKPGDQPALTLEERTAVIRFLQTLTDGWSPTRP
ncbi:cytochrome C peroxidase [Gluconobacter thailandicus]|uniref:cytochrome-c peroxidase n=1 Tax=Gluconobacter thailandicus TaxID=257438 RepID=UPI000776B59D|nr:cytochrome C peroxidase [Gluconobacter thailandicus]